MTLAQDITKRFNGDWHGDYGAFPTPGHSPSDRGTTVKDDPGAPDGVLINSFNGGDAIAIKDQCREWGILPSRDADQIRIRSTWRVTGSFEYVDEDGAVLYRTQRREKAGERKKFVAERLNGTEWAGGIKGVRRVLYRLPEILAAPADEPVYLVEGERKADKLASWGLIGTAVAFGSNGWLSSYADALAGRTVIILPDNDDVGRAFAEKAGADLQGAGCSIRIIDLPGLPPKGDIMDWSGSADDLRALVEKVEVPAAETFAVADLGAWSTIQPTPKAFIMAGFVPARELTLATGAGGANKSTFGQQLATCCAAGVPMLGIDVMQGPALYITAEDDDDRLHWMQTHICRALAVDMAGMVGKLHLVSLRGRLGNELATFDAEGKLRPAPSFQLLKATIEQTGSSLVVLDNAAHLFAGNENDRQQVTAFVNLLYSLCRDLGVTIILVAHSNKAGDSYSGSTAWLNAVRSQIVLQRPEGAIDPDERLLTLGKANYARQGEELRCRWHEFALVRDEDLPADLRQEMAATVQASHDNDVFLRCLDIRNGQERAVSENAASAKTYAPKVFAEMPESKGVGIKRLEAAMDRLFRTGSIERGFLWREDRKDKFGLRRPCADPAQECADPRADPAPTRCADPAFTPLQPRTHTHPISKDIPGAALQGPAPDLDDDGLDESGDIIGWNDKPHGGR
ncbi:AAA family ATPase [Sphingobium sp. LF-16]|uniref:AAA family ATPase n=1 Tax=Sphingobium sp. LF-16 TaxID=2185111 RepID=UPI000F078A7B|nr:AAA family ATPase [Sphingobium sp. LF-16]